MTTHTSSRWSTSRWWVWPNRPVRPVTMLLVVCAWIATVGNVALWKQLSTLGVLAGVPGGLLMAGLAGFALGILLLIMSVFAWSWTLKPALVLLLLVTAGSAHFTLSFGTIMDPTMMANMLQTDSREATDLLTPALIGHALLLGVLPAVWVVAQSVSHGSVRLASRRNAKLAVSGLLVAVLAVLMCSQPLASTMRNHKQVRYLINPLNLMYSLGSALFSGPARSRQAQPIGEDAAFAKRFEGLRPPLLVLVVGETARSDNFGINGYGRQTTPLLAAEDIVSFRNAWSCGTSTAASVPCMFSRLPRSRFFDRDHDEEGLLDVLQRAGYGVLWVDNQAGCKGVCDRVPFAKVEPSEAPSLCSGEECLDEALLVHLDDRLQALPAERRARGVVVVLHQMGSHGPAYHRRSPSTSKPFRPECTSSQLQDCSSGELVNAYDNSIAYTDRMLAGTIRWLKEKDVQWSSAMIYVSDHGESLGEHNLYLHGFPYALAPDVQKHVPWVNWMSSQFRQGAGVDWKCLSSRRDAEVLHDHLFHSVLGLMNVSTSVYDPGLDIYAQCRRSYLP